MYCSLHARRSLVVEAEVMAAEEVGVHRPVARRKIVELIVGPQLFAVALLTLTPTPASDLENISLILTDGKLNTEL